MYLSVQKVIGNKKYQGSAKGIVQTEMSWGYDGKSYIHYGWKNTEERFERENIIYRFVVKKSYRENGKVKQLQFFLGRLDWWAMDSPGDYFIDFLSDKKISKIKAIFNPSEDELQQLQDKICAEIDECTRIYESIYKKSEECKVVAVYQKRLDKWNQAKKDFGKKYGDYSEKDFDAIYNIDLKLMNKELLEDYKSAKKYSERSEKSRYSDYSSSNYSYSGSSSGTDYSSYFKTSSSNYSDEEKQALKKFYKKLAMEFHPDRNIDTDTTKEMQLLNKLKEEWNL